MLSEIDKWSQKYMKYRKAMAVLIAILILSIVGFFFTLNSVGVSMICLVITFITVIAIRICMGKMDEFKSLYVSTVPMIDPEKNFKEEKSDQHDEIAMNALLGDVESLMEQFVCEEDSVDVILESLIEEQHLEIDEELELVTIEEIGNAVEPELTSEINEIVHLEDTSDENSVVEETKLQMLEEIVLTETLVESEIENQVEESLEALLDSVDVTTLEDSEKTEAKVEMDLILDEFNESMKEDTGIKSEVTNELQVEFASLEVEPLTLEQQVMKIIEQILRKNGKEIEKISSKIVGNYFTIYGGRRVLCRLKLTGRKRYVLTQLTEEQVVDLGLQYERPSKSEAFESRIHFTSIDVLEHIQQHLVELYDRCF